MSLDFRCWKWWPDSPLVKRLAICSEVEIKRRVTPLLELATFPWIKWKTTSICFVLASLQQKQHFVTFKKYCKRYVATFGFMLQIWMLSKSGKIWQMLQKTLSQRFSNVAKNLFATFFLTLQKTFPSFFKRCKKTFGNVFWQLS